MHLNQVFPCAYITNKQTKGRQFSSIIVNNTKVYFYRYLKFRFSLDLGSMESLSLVKTNKQTKNLYFPSGAHY